MDAISIQPLMPAVLRQQLMNIQVHNHAFALMLNTYGHPASKSTLDIFRHLCIEKFPACIRTFIFGIVRIHCALILMEGGPMLILSSKDCGKNTPLLTGKHWSKSSRRIRKAAVPSTFPGENFAPIRAIPSQVLWSLWNSRSRRNIFIMAPPRDF